MASDVIMAHQVEDFIRVINRKIIADAPVYSAWYIGIALDVKKELFANHKVSDQNDQWIYVTVNSNETAKQVKSHFVKLGVTSNENKFEEVGLIVYAYKKTSTTKE